MSVRGYPPRPTRPAARMYDEVYRRTPNWEVGRPQRAFVRLEEAGLLGERVLDVGCGTGELSIYLAHRGHRVLGIDFSREAIAQAREKARWRGVDVPFLVMDALDAERLGLTFDSVCDSAMFHVLGNAERERFVDALRAVLRPGGRYFVLGDARPERAPIGGYGLSRRELQNRFTERRGWRVEFAIDAVYERRWSRNPALLAGITRL